MNLARLITYHAWRFEQDPAVAFAGGIATYRSLFGAVSAAVETLQTIGVRRGTLVALDIRNPVYHVAMIYALALCGIRSASVSSSYAIEPIGPKPALFLVDHDEIPSNGMPAQRVDARWFAFDETKPVDYQGLLALPGFDADIDVFRLIFSSGTTGRAKCVGLTERAFEHRITRQLIQAPRASRSGAVLNTMGFSTIIGTMTPFFTHLQGSLQCFAGSGAEAVQMMRAFGVSYLTGSVTQLDDIVVAIGDAPPPPALRTISVIGARLPADRLEVLQTRLTNHVSAVYGSTEMGRVSYVEGTDLGRGTVGRVMPYVEAQIVDENDRILERGAEGIIRVKTEELAVYIGDDGRPLPTADANGWFYPGDVGSIDANGVLTITGRTSEIINRGGIIVAPDLIEDVLRLDKTIRDVAVVAVPNASGIDEIWAAVVSSPGFDAVAMMEAARLRLGERKPDRVVEVSAIPRNENGKVRRGFLREQLLQRDP